MAKVVNTYGKAPWIMSKREFDEFIQVTAINKEAVLITGRILYVIDVLAKNYKFRGTMTIDPFFDKGYFNYPFMPWHNSSKSHFRVFFNESMNYNEWIHRNRSLVNLFMAEKSLYMKPSDPLLKYYKI